LNHVFRQIIDTNGHHVHKIGDYFGWLTSS
jgi:hypothetical protein